MNALSDTLEIEPLATESAPPVLPRTAKVAQAAPSAWASALRRCLAEQARQGHKTVTAPLFANYGAVHRVVVGLLHDLRSSLPAEQQQRIVNIDSSKGLLATCCLASGRVQLRQDVAVQRALALPQNLYARLMPVSAKLLSAEMAQSFVELSLPTLLWHWGQTAPEALERVPDLSHYLLRVPRFPALPPQALLLRQLKLIHQLGGQALPFAALQQLSAPQEISPLCADLASLYLSRSLQLRPL